MRCGAGLEKDKTRQTTKKRRLMKTGQNRWKIREGLTTTDDRGQLE